MINVLSIAGYDPSGGAGVLADVKTFDNHKVQGFAVSTAMTYQNAKRFDGVQWESIESIKKQLAPILDESEITAVKIGLIDSLETMNVLLGLFDPEVRVVWDPVLSASAGPSFHEGMTKELLEKTLSRTDCITPNIPESEKLMEVLEIDTPSEIPVKHMVLKGGHGNGEILRDQLWQEGAVVHEIHRNKLEGQIHGSGCAFSSALAASWATRNDIQVAFETANEYVYKLIANSEEGLAKHFMGC